MITEKELKKLIHDVRKDLLTSNNIVDRMNYPYYYDHESVPKPLFDFKEKLMKARCHAAQLVEKQPALDLPNLSREMCCFSEGTFAHQLTVGLAVSLLGIGDCGECSAQLGLRLIQSGFGNLAWVGIEFSSAKEGMEKYHSFIVANLPTLPPLPNAAISVDDFLKRLPPEAFIADGFLELVFSPHNIPEAFTRYVNTYGTQTKVFQNYHFYNVSPRSIMFGSYLRVAHRVVKALRSNPLFPQTEWYPLEEKIKVKETTLITALKMGTTLSFFGVRDDDYKVDAVVELSTEKDRRASQKLQQTLKGHGRFFNAYDGKNLFVLEGINLSSENLPLMKAIQNLPQRPGA